jgi:hypothetical protein
MDTENLRATAKKVSIAETAIAEQIKEKELIAAAKMVSSWAAVFRVFGITRSAKAQAILRKRAQEWGVKTDHFIWSGNYLKHHARDPKQAIADYASKKHRVKTKNYKRLLIDQGLLKNACACGQGPVWNGRPLPLILVHKDGDTLNHEVSNLKLTCPNCHYQNFNPTRGREARQRRLREQNYKELAIAGKVNGSDSTGIEH